MAKPTDYFGEFRLAGVISLWHLADEDGIPDGTRWSDGYRGAFALRMFAQFGCDYALEFCGAFCRFLKLPKRGQGQDDYSHDQTGPETDNGHAGQRIMV